MASERDRNIHQIFEEVFRIEKEEREDYIKKACGEDEEMIKEIASLLYNAKAAEQEDFLGLMPQLIIEPSDQQDSDNDLVGKLVGKIRLIKKIGSGGMGTVYLGYDETLKRNVAVKTLHGKKHLDEKTKERFMREARMLSQLNHPWICTIHDLIEYDQRIFLILEHVDGKSLAEAVEGGLSFNQKLEISKQIAEVLTIAHGKGIVHRDLKPENIMITKNGDVKTLDFGLSRLIDSHLETVTIHEDQLVNTSIQPTSCGIFETQSGTVTGTPMFMSPEQARGEEVTTATDICSLGLLMQWMFTNKMPYAKKINFLQVLMLASEGKSEPATGLDRDLTALINRMKHIVIGMRPVAPDVKEQINLVQEKPRLKRRRTIYALVTSLMFTLACISTWGFISAKKSQSMAIQAEQKAKKAFVELESGMDFLSSLFYSPGQMEESLVENKIISVNDRVFEIVEQMFATKLHSKLAIYNGLMNVFMDMRDYNRYYQCSKKSYEITLELYGPEHHRTLMAMGFYGQGAKFLNKNSEAEVIYRKKVEIHKKRNGRHHPKTLRALSDLAHFLYYSNSEEETGKEEAETIYWQVVNATENMGSLNEDEKRQMRMEISGAVFYLARILTANGKSDQALLLHQKELEQLRSELGEDHERTLKAKLTLARFLKEELNRSSQALPLFEEVVKKTEQSTMDPNRLAWLRMHLADCYSSTEEYEKAEALYKSSLKALSEKVDPSDNDVQNTLVSYARCLSRQKKYEQAILLWENAISAIDELYGSNDPRSFVSRQMLASQYGVAKQFTKSEILLKSLLNLRIETLGRMNRDTLWSVHKLAGTYLMQKKYKLAKQILMKHIIQLEPGSKQKISNRDVMKAKNQLELIVLATVFEEKGLDALANSAAKMAGSEHLESLLNNLGYIYLGLDDRASISIFNLNVTLHPKSWNVYDSLAESYLRFDEKKLARFNYRKSIGLNPGNQSATNALKHL